MNWNNQQKQALDLCARWMKDPSSQVFYLAGYAGTGKTTLAKHLIDSEFPTGWLFAAYTGKAAHVLKQKGCPNTSTLHSLIYKPAGETKKHDIMILEQRIIQAIRDEIEEEKIEKMKADLKKLTDKNQPMFSLWLAGPLSDPNVQGIVVDEVSMVDERIGRDLESFGKKILVLGDPAQLPPVGAGGYFTKREPDYMLTDVHRHAKESGILRLATMIRKGGQLHHFDSTDDVNILFECDSSKEEMADISLNADQVLVGLNGTRRAINNRFRTLLGMTEPGPMPGDRLVCLRNERELGLYNGSQWRVLDAEADMDYMTAFLHIKGEDNDTELELESWLHHMVGKTDELKAMGWDKGNYSEFDWSYAMTVHKSQGSQWDNVVVFDQSSSFRSFSKRWLYTAITRAAKKLTVIIH